MHANLKTALTVVAMAFATHAAAEVTFYENEGFTGRAFSADRSVRDFRAGGFNDRASSVVVTARNYEVCVDVQYAGQCRVLRPGRYPSLASMGMNDRISSVRSVGSNARYSEDRYAPSPNASWDGKDYRRRNQERLYEANVTSARAVVGAPEQRCWIEREQVPQQRSINVPGAVVGAVIGGVLGHQVGHGTGQDLATVGGAAAGGYIGSKVGSGQASAPQEVQKCASAPSQVPTYWDVTYNFRGQDHRVQMTNRPGATVRV